MDGFSLNQLITILGPTATGKTQLAAQLAFAINGEIISADSRQVYKGANICSGKDLNEYTIEGKSIPYHLIDTHTIGEEYNVFEFQKDFHEAYSSILKRNNTPILCGGTGLYIQSVLEGYRLNPAPKNIALRHQLDQKPQEELNAILKSYTSTHNTTDLLSAERTIRAIEIASFNQLNVDSNAIYNAVSSIIFGIKIDRELVKQKITDRLKERLNTGMIEEVEQLIKQGITQEQLFYLGLEYRFIAQYLNGELDQKSLFEKLNIAIHQFSKKQMTWFRKMEKNGHQIHWIDGNKTMNEKLDFIQSIL